MGSANLGSATLGSATEAGAAAASAAADTHHITVCVSCRHTGDDCRPGKELIEKLARAIAAAGPLCADAFEVSGVACMAGCSRPCTVAYHASQKATYLFGDIDPASDIDDLVAFAAQYLDLHDGWCSSTSRPPGLSGKTLARVPAALLISHHQLRARDDREGVS